MLLVKTTIYTVSSAQPKVDLPLLKSGPQVAQLALKLLVSSLHFPVLQLMSHISLVHTDLLLSTYQRKTARH